MRGVLGTLARLRRLVCRLREEASFFFCCFLFRCRDFCRDRDFFLDLFADFAIWVRDYPLVSGWARLCYAGRFHHQETIPSIGFSSVTGNTTGSYSLFSATRRSGPSAVRSSHLMVTPPSGVRAATIF